MQKIVRLGLSHVPPNFLYRLNLAYDGVVIDGGCSYEAEFSKYMIERHGVKCFAVDPTRKHRSSLLDLEARYKGSFVYLPLAISSRNGYETFFESRDNESGSLVPDHCNVKNDEVVSYEVEAVTIPSLLKRIGVERVSVMKLDLEGAEYDLLELICQNDLRQIDQIFIEFHHHAIEMRDKNDTMKLVKKVSGFGFNAYSLDDHNYLFYR